MLKRWIDEIRKQSDLYATDSWKYLISGNSVEFSIVPVYIQDKKNYRCSVIAVGQVLKTLSCYLEQRHCHYHIQSFQNLDNPGLVATLRMDESNSISIRNLKNQQKYRSLKNSQPESAIRTLAKQYKLDIREISEPFMDANLKDCSLCFALYSTYNNPFTWLNIGYWKETIQNDCHHLLPPQEYKIIDFFKVEEEKPFENQNKYLQFVIGIKPSAVTQ